MTFPRCYTRMERKLKKFVMTLTFLAIVITSFYFYKAETTLKTEMNKRNKIARISDRLAFSKKYGSSLPERAFSAKSTQKKDDNLPDKSNITVTENYFGPPRNDLENESFFLYGTFWDNSTNQTAVVNAPEKYTEIHNISETGDETAEGTVSLTPPSTNGLVTSTSRDTGAELTPSIDTESAPISPSGEAVSQNEGNSWLDNREEEFALRSKHLRDICRQFKVQQNASATQVMASIFQNFNNPDNYVEYVSPDNFRLARSASTMTCLINKVASTSVAVALLQADDRPVPEWTGALSPHNAATVLKPKTQVEFNFARKHFFKFLLVRHPFDRLLSAYRDKVERANHWSLLKLRQHISNSLKEVQRETSEHSPTAPGNGRNQSATAATLETDPVPTFSDFLEYILTTNLSGGGFDSHWAPYWRTCTPCSVNYNIIAKLETADLDLKPVGERMGLQWTSLSRFNRSGAEGSLSQSDIVDQYYRGLHPALIGRVYRRFALDFHLFQYDIMDVFRRGGHCQTHKCSEMMSRL